MDHMEACDGVMAWKALKEYYGLEKHKTAKCKQLMDKLQNIQLHENSHGGMDEYLNKFEWLSHQIRDYGGIISDDLKKSILLKNIRDKYYVPYIAVCSRLDPRDTMQELRAAAFARASMKDLRDVTLVYRTRLLHPRDSVTRALRKASRARKVKRRVCTFRKKCGTR